MLEHNYKIGQRVRSKKGKLGTVEDVYGYPGGWVVRWDDGSITLHDFFAHNALSPVP